MNTRDQFGQYLLLKKLTEDGLGETFRAGRLGRQTLERVVLLRVYNGPGLDGERVARTIQSRGALAQGLKSPNIANAVDSGQVRGVPYVAYDYVAGRTLAQLAEQAIKRGQPVPLDQSLLIAERLAAGLAVAFETRFGDDRIVHGMMTPHQVMVSHEGELRLSGFEAAPGLRASATHPVIKQTIGRYLAPEALAGQPVAKNDDVYSLGAILYELLTGQAVPVMPPAGLGTAIEQAVVAADGGNLHPDLAALLKRSLCPRDQRVGDVVAWHKTLAKLMSDGQYNPTTFNLAFFLHNLFRDEIERETQELETEKTQAISIQMPPAPAPAAPQPVTPAAAAPSPVRDSGPVRETTDMLRAEYGIGEKPAASKMPLIAAVAGAVVVVLAVGGYFLFVRGKGQAAAPEAPPPAVEAAKPAAPAGPTPEEIQAQIAKMVADQSKQLEASVKAQYDEQMKALQKQLEDARKAQEEARRAPAPAPVTTSPLAPRQVEPVAPAQTSAPTTLPAASAPPPTTPRPAAPPATTPAATTPATTPPAAAPQPAVAAPAATPPAPATVRVGDLVSPGLGVLPPRVVRKPVLNYPPIAQRMKKEATVELSVLIDENGKVAEVKNIGGKAGFGMDEAAVEYARDCTWAPATKDGVRVKMWYELKVAFSLGGH
jgi:TonB family protein